VCLLTEDIWTIEETGGKIMFINKKAEIIQEYRNQKLRFDPDSSPEAWKHYKEYYLGNSKLRANYDFNRLFFYNCYKDVGQKTGYKNNGTWFNYTNSPLAHKSKYNRLFALENQAEIAYYENIEYCGKRSRIGGDCDFNFNEKKYKLFEGIIGDNKIALQQLNRCSEMHHTLINFSLMQALGDMQGLKGNDRFDRFDTFIYELDRYFLGISHNVISASTSSNKSDLIAYLNNFESIYEYCEEVYFIQDKKFIDEIIAKGALPMKECDDVIRYMDLAEKFWAAKDFYFLRKEFLTIGNYFNNGGETYTLGELLIKIKNDLGYGQTTGEILIKKCVGRGFIIDCGSDTYTR
jgi:hypothetical protein